MRATRDATGGRAALATGAYNRDSMQDGPVTITDPRVEDYTLAMAQLGGEQSLPEGLPAVLREMEELAAKLSFPIAGPLVGRTLYMLAGLSGARRILDAGSGFGYGAAWLAAGAGPGATVICVERSQDHLIRARDFHRQARLAADFEYRVGDAVETLKAEAVPFGLIYNDIDKGSYPEMIALAVQHLRPGGLYMADNALWYGKVCSSRTTRDAWTAAIDHHNRWAFACKQLFTTIVDQREGLLVAVKRAG